MRLRHAPRQQRALDDDELAYFMAVADRDKRAAWLLCALFSQLRPGELSGPRWTDVDLVADAVTVAITRRRDTDMKFILGDGLKTPSRRRQVTMSAVCVDALRAHSQAQITHRLAAPIGFWQDLVLVFPISRGGVMDPSAISYSLKRDCQRAGIEPPLRPHELRHTALSLLVRLRVDIRTVSERTGHNSTKITLDHYVHPSVSQHRATADTLSSALERLRQRFDASD